MTHAEIIAVKKLIRTLRDLANQYRAWALEAHAKGNDAEFDRLAAICFEKRRLAKAHEDDVIIYGAQYGEYLE